MTINQAHENSEDLLSHCAEGQDCGSGLQAGIRDVTGLFLLKMLGASGPLQHRLVVPSICTASNGWAGLTCLALN